MTREYLFVLPLPVCPPNIQGRLGGLALVKTDTNFNIIGKKELIHCALPPHILPSPTYLYSQGLIPNQTVGAISEIRLFNKIKELITDNTIIVTYSVRYLQILNAIALRSFCNPNILDKVTCILDLKNCLKASSIFGSLNLGKSKEDVASKAKALGLALANVKKDDFSTKLDCLVFIFRTLCTKEARLMQFFMQSTKHHINAIKQDIENKRDLVYLENSSGKVHIIKGLEVDGRLLKALCLIDNEVCKITIDLQTHELIAPISILTKERCLMLKLDKDAIVSTLESADENTIVNKEKDPFDIEYLKKLSAGDRELFFEIVKSDPVEYIHTHSVKSKRIRDKIFIFRAENYTGTLLDSEINTYYKIARINLEKQMPRYIKEANIIAQNIAENDDANNDLIAKIIKYPDTL